MCRLANLFFIKSSSMYGTTLFINFCLFRHSQLGKNKHVQDKLRDEIDKHCDKDGKIDFETINEMSYLDQVWNETMRMHPPATFLTRICTEEVELAFEGKKVLIEEGMNVYIPLHQVQNDSRNYVEPEKFMPERFDPETGGVKTFRDKGAFLPFGDGPRMCLGMRFAQTQSKAAIAALVRNYEISVNGKTAEKLIIDANEFINVKKGGLWLDFTPVTIL